MIFQSLSPSSLITFPFSTKHRLSISDKYRFILTRTKFFSLSSTNIMKTFSVLLVALVSAIAVDGRCFYGCYCVNDDPCEYYCDRNICQSQTNLWAKCAGQFIHPRQCGSVSYCDSTSNYTCQLQKNYGERCVYSYSCLSGYCDSGSRTCQSAPISFAWILPVAFSSTFVFILVLVVVIIAVNRQRRLRALAFYRSPYLVLPASTPLSYQHSYMVGEAPPPAYPGVVPTPKPYQG